MMKKINSLMVCLLLMLSHQPLGLSQIGYGDYQQVPAAPSGPYLSTALSALTFLPVILQSNSGEHSMRHYDPSLGSSVAGSSYFFPNESISKDFDDLSFGLNTEPPAGPWKSRTRVRFAN